MTKHLFIATGGITSKCLTCGETIFHKNHTYGTSIGKSFHLKTKATPHGKFTTSNTKST